ncbi:MAG TPA: phenylalanine--tRNA ligase subunit beta [Phycisphaerae bacterium]|nr:phenylalanine--tRNA ligase subunit beta [Phycisphaerae bacterium]HNU46024.1 phenylalanine--tRNA ligase subunit beta [Phycisphaerae bacterium]
MLISLNWLRDSVDVPAEVDPHELAERFTCTAAEVEDVHRIEVGARGLIAARVEAVSDLPATRNLRLARLDVGDGRVIETVTAAPVLRVGWNVVYAPAGAAVAKLGTIGQAKVAGRASVGMILSGDALGVEMAVGEALFAEPALAPGTPLPPEWFDDWVIEIDNKSITHRPDLWGHRGIAREVAAMYGLPLKPYPVVAVEELAGIDAPPIPLEIQDPQAARRYSGLRLGGVPTQPAPLWLQLRLGRVGMRPISALVDLTNYIMADLGQPMHAFDGSRVERIEVGWAAEGEVFRTLDGVERTLPPQTLMIQSQGRSIALAGIMGGLETEVSEATTSLLLESANFDAATIRRSAIALGLRTDASARFEKSLDPVNTVLSIQRFVALARECYPDLKLTSPLSDCFPNPFPPVTVKVNRRHVTRTVGREVPDDEVRQILGPLGFDVTAGRRDLSVSVPSFRATGDVDIEADVIEEIARYCGYNRIPEVLPQVTVRRFEPCARLEVERRTLAYFSGAARFSELHQYLWYDSAWLTTLGFEPGACVELANPAATGLHRLRQTLLPGLLAALVRNRFHYEACALLEVGSVFERAEPDDAEFRHVGLVCARRQKGGENELYHRLKTALEGWGWECFGRAVSFGPAAVDTARPWEHPQRTAEVQLEGRGIGRLSAVPLELKRRMEEHLTAWAIAWAEVRLTGLEKLSPRTEALGRIPPHPLVELDFSVLVRREVRYAEVADRLREFTHPLLRRVAYVGSYEGPALPQQQRSLTFRVVVGDETRTLVEEDTAAFRATFEQHLASCGYWTRR